MEKELIKQYLHSDWIIQTAEEVSSTNDILKEQAKGGAPDRTVLIAGRQTKGKGRMGRSFYSPQDDGIYLSMLLRPPICPQEALLLTTAAAAAAAEAIDASGGGPAFIKWVNDVYCREKKVVGILTEAGFSGDDPISPLDYAVVGIGFNVFEPVGGYPEDIRHLAGAVFSHHQRPNQTAEREEKKALLTALFLDRMDEYYRCLPEKKFMEVYRQKSFLIGKDVRMMTAEHETSEKDSVRVIGIGDDAELIVKDKEGKISRLFSGEVSIREI